jgi:hypothetical protein
MAAIAGVPPPGQTRSRRTAAAAATRGKENGAVVAASKGAAASAATGLALGSKRPLGEAAAGEQPPAKRLPTLSEGIVQATRRLRSALLGQ